MATVEVTVTVQAGDVATVVRVLATVDDGNGNQVSTVSDLLTVTTGLPDQNSISLAIGECGGESSFVVDGAMTIDGLCRTLTVSMADKFNNPVVDGTAAVFTTEYGVDRGFLHHRRWHLQCGMDAARNHGSRLSPVTIT